MSLEKNERIERMLNVVEIFGPTIQGEGRFAGDVVIFVRMSGCDSKCVWCDTPNKSAGIQLSAEMIVHAIVQKSNNRLITHRVVITGGNPLLQELSYLIKLLQDKDFEVHIETQGTIWKNWLHNADYVSVSFKGPSSGNTIPIKDAVSFIQNLDNKEVFYDLKLAVDITQDVDFVKELITALANRNLIYTSIILQPVAKVTNSFDVVEYSKRYSDLVKFVIEDNLKYSTSKIKVLPQLHKIVWGNQEGV